MKADTYLKNFFFFQGNTLNQHPGINLQNAIQAGLCAGQTQGAYKWLPRLKYPLFRSCLRR